MAQPKYPIYVLSKGRYDCSPHQLTADCLIREQTKFFLVVEKQEHLKYAERYGNHSEYCTILVLPPESTGRGAIPVRNWIWNHAIESKSGKHWQLDDNLRQFQRRYKGERITCDPKIALRVCEDFTDRYTNIGMSGLTYSMFAPSYCKLKPYQTNCHVYSCILLDNKIEPRWRGKYNADTDLCLQVLAAGLCTVLLNAFMVHKMETMTMKGGNTDMYQGDGRLEMARALERVWPGTVTTTRKFGRPQHHVNWRRFDTKLIRRTDIDWKKLQKGKVDEYGMKMRAVDTVQNSRLKRLLKENRNGTTD